jgi:hypothetical protein
MDANEYREYRARVADFRDRENIKFFAPFEQQLEPYFSWHNCECCKRPLGGNREDYIADTGLVYSICDDCVYYNEYGRLDDMTMLEIEKEQPCE